MIELIKNLFIPRYANNYYPHALRKGVFSVATLAVLAVNLLGGAFGMGAFAGSISASELVALTNSERTVAGLGTLRTDPKLVSAAQAKAADMFSKQYWAHYGPNGETPWQFILGAGYSYVYAGENLAKGFNSSEAVHSAWMASKTHRENILGQNYRDIGIAVVSGTLQGTEVLLVVQMFGSLTQSPVMPAQTAPAQSSPNPSTPTVPQTYSVTIDSPDEGALTSDQEMTMTGTASSNVSSLTISDNDEPTDGVIPEDGAWDYRPDGGWEDGTHAVTVQDSKKQASDAVTFEVDTLPPVIDSAHLTISEPDEDTDVVQVSVPVDETAEDVVFVAGDFSVMMEQTDGVYTIDIPRTEIDNEISAKVVATDAAGNYSEIDVTNAVLGSLSVREETSGGLLGLSLGDFPKLVTRVMVIAVALLLCVDAVYLYKLNIAHTRGKTLFPMALWVVVMAVGLAVGSSGQVL